MPMQMSMSMPRCQCRNFQMAVKIILNTKVKVIEIKHYQLKKYLYKISPYLKGINNLKKSDSWKFN